MTDSIDNRRRTLLKLSGLLGLAALSPVTLLSEHAEALWFNRKRHKVSSTRLTMGTFVAITAIHTSRDEAESAIGRAFEEIQRLAFLLSRHEPRSPISELNRIGVLHDIPAEVHEVMTGRLFLSTYRWRIRYFRQTAHGSLPGRVCGGSETG